MWLPLSKWNQGRTCFEHKSNLHCCTLGCNPKLLRKESGVMLLAFQKRQVISSPGESLHLTLCWQPFTTETSLCFTANRVPALTQFSNLSVQDQLVDLVDINNPWGKDKMGWVMKLFADSSRGKGGRIIHHGVYSVTGDELQVQRAELITEARCFH